MSNTQKAFIGLVMLSAAYPLLFFGMYAGDAEIHLVFAENASKGHFFEFNLGEPSSGVTSPGYMLLLAIFFKTLNPETVPLAVKALNLVSWYALLFYVYKLASLLIPVKAWVYVVAIISAVLPGSAYNSTLGMENGMFALLVILTLYLMASRTWFEAQTLYGLRDEFLFGTILGVASWIRPEGMILGLLLISIRLTGRLWMNFSTGVLKRSFFFLCPFLALSSLAVLFQYYFTGDMICTSGRSRIVLGLQQGIVVGPLSVNPTFAIRLLYYFPLTLFFGIGVLLAKQELEECAKGNWNSVISARLAIMIIFGSFFVMYSTVLGGHHLSRYVIFIMPLFVITAGIGASWLWANWVRVKMPKVLKSHSVKVAFFTLCGVALAGAFGAETYLRTGLGRHDALRWIMEAPGQRKQFSDTLYQRLGAPTVVPISLAYEEIQIRYHLDEQFMVRSLCGRTDADLWKYFRNGYFDHVGYLKEKRVNFVLDFPNLNRDASAWSLQRLEGLSAGDVVAHGAARFVCLGPRIVRVFFDGE